MITTSMLRCIKLYTVTSNSQLTKGFLYDKSRESIELLRSSFCKESVKITAGDGCTVNDSTVGGMAMTEVQCRDSTLSCTMRDILLNCYLTTNVCDKHPATFKRIYRSSMIIPLHLAVCHFSHP